MLKALNKVSPRVSERTGTIRDPRYVQTPVSRSPSVRPGAYEPLEDDTNDGPEVVPNDSRIADSRSAEISEDVRTVEPYPRVGEAIVSGTVSIVIDADVHQNRES